MLGYVRAFKPEMKMKDYELYKGVYCSLCRSLGRLYSPIAQLFLSYDFALAAVLRLAVSESGSTFSQKRCPYNPAKKCMICAEKNDIDFCTHALIITVYYKVIDNLHDRGFGSKIAAALLFPIVSLMHRKAKRLAPQAESIISKAMSLQAEAENKEGVCLDEAAHPSAEALGKIFALGFDGEQKDALYMLGYMVGRYVYILDAADDLESDKKSGSFNPFKGEDIADENGRKAFAAKVIGMLNLTQSSALEALDAIETKRFFEILDNIVFDGLTASAKRTFAKYSGENLKSKEYTVN